MQDACEGWQTNVLAHEFGHALTWEHIDELNYNEDGHSSDSADLMFAPVNRGGVRITFAEANVINPSGT